MAATGIATPMATFAPRLKPPLGEGVGVADALVADGASPAFEAVVIAVPAVVGFAAGDVDWLVEELTLSEGLPVILK